MLWAFTCTFSGTAAQRIKVSSSEHQQKLAMAVQTERGDNVRYRTELSLAFDKKRSMRKELDLARLKADETTKSRDTPSSTRIPCPRDCDIAKEAITNSSQMAMLCFACMRVLRNSRRSYKRRSGTSWVLHVLEEVVRALRRRTPSAQKAPATWSVRTVAPVTNVQTAVETQTEDARHTHVSFSLVRPPSSRNLRPVGPVRVGS